MRWLLIATHLQRWIAGSVACLCIMTPLMVIADDHPIRAVVYGSPPWIINNGESGVAPYYARKFSEITQLSVELVPMPYKRSVMSINSPDVDYVLAFPSQELQEQADIFMKVGKLAIVVFSANPVEHLYNEDDEAVSVALVAGSAYQARQYIPNWSTVMVSHEQSALLAAAKGRLDAAVVTRNAYEYWLEQHPEIAEGYVKDVGLGQIYAWIKKGRQPSKRLDNMRELLQMHTFNGNLVMDWYTVNLRKAHSPRP